MASEQKFRRNEHQPNRERLKQEGLNPHITLFRRTKRTHKVGKRQREKEDDENGSKLHDLKQQKHKV